MRLLIGLLSLVSISLALPYINEQVIRLHAPHSPSALYVLEDVDVWATHPGRLMDVRVNPDQLARLLAHGFEFDSIFIEDLAGLIDAEFQRITAGRVDDFYGDFRTVEEIYSRVDDLAKSHSDIVTLIPSIGKTSEGRDIRALRISSGSGSVSKRVYFQGMQHARVR